MVSWGNFFKSLLTAGLFFIPLTLLGFFAPIALPLSPLFILAASGLGSIVLSRVFFNSLFEYKFENPKYLAIPIISCAAGIALLAALAAGISATLLPFSLPFFLAACGLGALVGSCLGSHVATAVIARIISGTESETASAGLPAAPAAKEDNPWCPMCHPINHLVKNDTIVGAAISGITDVASTLFRNLEVNHPILEVNDPNEEHPHNI
jgi:hypothetical protein